MNRYKVTISCSSVYKEIELTPQMQQVKIGTGVDCDVRLRKELFFEPIEILFVRTDQGWSAHCSDSIYFAVGDIRKMMTKVMAHGDTIKVNYQKSDSLVFVMEFLVDFDDGKKKYERIIDVSTAKALTIGNRDNCNIEIGNEYAKSDDLILKRVDNGFALGIKNTTYGVYINGKKAAPGEIIKNGDFLSIADYYFYFKSGKMRTQIRPDLFVHELDYVDDPERNMYPSFNRNTRIQTVINRDEIEVLDPPSVPQKPKNNLMTRIIPSLGMLAVAAAMAFFGGAMIIMSAVSGAMAIVTSIVTLQSNKREYKKNVEERISKYNAYIANKKEEIKKLRDEERKTLNTIFISQAEELARFNEFSSNLFDRTNIDEDFLCVRLGDGDIEANRKIKFKKQERLEVEDELQLMPKQISDEFRCVTSAPVVCDLKTVNAIGIVGDEAFRYSILKNLVIDITARQYFSDVKLAFVAEKCHADKIAWLRLLPHTYIESEKLRTIITDNESKNIVFEFLYKELTIREQTKSIRYRIVVFFYDEYGFKNHPISKFVEKAKELGVTFVFFGEKEADVPLGCGYIVEKDEKQAYLISASDSKKTVAFTYPTITDADARRVVTLLAPVYSEEISLSGTLTKSISMFEMLNILAVDDLNLESRWSASQVFKSMAAPIGVTTNGLISLDLHDKAHGPHGLVAGTTGSGKSEVLQTYILSMATLFHPYEVGFVIIDFKGGGMVNQFKDLPHLMGAITNIDGKEIDRSLKSIKAELQKRQRLFADAEVNHIDKYIKKYKNGEVSVPLPHLVLIVDEFAELKAEQPEFMKELISAARIGRSLGVHLILATQKPSGQVNEQIWSNSRFKLCLKVQSQEDSNEVLKSPLAAEIKEPGRAYLQVGNNELFELFQSAYSGASEKVDDASVKEFTIYSLSPCGKRTPVYTQKKKTAGGSGRTQLDAIVGYVSSYCESKSIVRLPSICLPPLADYVTIPANLESYPLDSIPLGIYDDPDSQYQGLAKFNLCDDNTMIIGSSLTGKTNLIQCIIRLIADRFAPADAVFYIADFGAMYLKNYEMLHHVGGVVTIAEGEKLKNLFKLLMEEVQYRKARFLDCGLSSFSAYREAGYGDMPHIFFVIDNFSAFKEVYADTFEDQFIYLSREGISCGISIIMTNASTNGLGYRYMSNFACRLAFKCNDDNEYTNIFERCRMQPKDVPGRMLCKINKELVEMQSFIAFEGQKEVDRSNAVKEFANNVNAKYRNEYAKRIPSIPEVLTLDYIDANYNFKADAYQIPVALDYENVDVVAIDFKAWNEFCIIGKDSKKRLSATNNLLSAIHHNVLSKPVSLYIIDGIERRLKDKADLGYVEKYTIDYSEIGSILDNLLPEMEKRHQFLVDGDFERLSRCAQIIVIVNSKEAVEYMSSTKEVLEIYTKMIKQCKALGMAFVFTDIEDTAVSYSGPELLKRFKESKKAIITSNLQEFKFFDLPSNAVRNNKTVNAGDVFLVDGADVSRIKLAEEPRR